MINRLPIIGQQDNKPQGPNKKVSVKHLKALNDMLKAIVDTPMDDVLKTIMCLRLWGENRDKWNPMSKAQIAASWIRAGKLKSAEYAYAVEVIEKLEKEGMAHVRNHLERVSMFDIIHRANEGESLWSKVKKLFNPEEKVNLN